MDTTPIASFQESGIYGLINYLAKPYNVEDNPRV